jgi:predicted dehydrogenase
VVRWYDAATKAWTNYTQPETWEVNHMYVDEMKHFLACLAEERSTMMPVREAAALMRVVFAAKTSVEEGKMVAVAGAAPK